MMRSPGNSLFKLDLLLPPPMKLLFIVCSEQKTTRAAIVSMMYCSSPVSILGSRQTQHPFRQSMSMILFAVVAFVILVHPSAAAVTGRKALMRTPPSSESFAASSNTECSASSPIHFYRLLRLDVLGHSSAVLGKGSSTSDEFFETLRQVLNEAFAATCDDDEEMKVPKTIDALEIVPSSSHIIRSNVRGGQDYFSFLLNLNVTCDGSGCTEDSDLFIPTSGRDHCDHVSKSFRCRAQDNQRAHSLMPCECPTPKEFHLLADINEALKTGPLSEHIDSVMDMLELEIVPACEGLPEKTNFEATIEIQASHPSDSLSMEDIEFLNSILKDLYNDMNTRDDNFCDPEARQIESINLFRSEVQIIDGPFNSTDLWFKVSGTCYGCDTSDTHLFEYGSQASTRKLSDAAVASAECLCPRNAPLQAPSKADFVARFKDRVEILGHSSLAIAGTNEVQSFPCPTTSDEISVSTIVELKVPDKTADDVTLETQDFSSFEAAFARSYNMATEEYCDLIFRQVDVAEVSRVVPVSNDTIAVQVDLQGSCLGCNGQAISSIFDSYTNFDSQALLGASSRRKLQDDQCFCPLDSPNRGISEEEYIVGLQQLLLGEPNRGRIEAVQPCYLIESFENALLVTSKSPVDLSGYETFLADSFKSAANRNLGPDDICDPKFREVIDVTAQVGSFDNIQFSESPTLNPTFFPSAAPSAMPSFNILLNETASPDTDVPSSSPTASPTLEPTPLFESYTQYIAFFFTGTCRGCQGDNYFGNDSIGRRMAQQKRRAQEAGPSSSCYCPLDAVRFEETAPTLLEALQVEVNENSNIPEGTIVDSMTEVTPVSCEPSKNTFESNIVKIDISVIGELDVDTILLIAAATYNEMSQESYCDPWFRQIFDTKLIGTFSPLGLSQVEDESIRGFHDYTIEVSFQGECRGCSDGVSILETRTESSRKLESLGQPGSGLLALRALEEIIPEKCFCTNDAVADRAPSYDEFKLRLEENIRSVGSFEKMVCEVKQVSGEDASEAPSGERGPSEPPTILSSNPSAYPSTTPSAHPSQIPSDMPSTLPSSVPSALPSSLPSTQPSLMPSTSMVPSMSPSNKPSASVYPSEQPSSSPTSCIAESACNPQKACQRSQNLCAGPESCSGKNSCRATLNADIESNSCIGVSACQSLTGTVGDDSCQGVSACGLPSVKNQLIIGHGSCVGYESCFQIKSSTNRGNREKDTIIGDGSCDAPNACSNFQGVSIGSNSCNCEGCCSCFATGELPDDIPSDSCNVKGECCSTDAPSMMPSSQPSAMPSTPLPVFDLPLSECKTVGSTTSIVNCLSGPDLLADPNSPQSQALQWILDSPQVDNWGGLELSQRYIIGVFYASSDGGLQSFGNQGTLICDTPDLSCNAGNDIIDINFSFEGLVGTLPLEVGALTALQDLTLRDNDFTGPIPSEIGLLTQLRVLNLHSNSFTGSIPTVLGQLTALSSLWLGGSNKLTGTIPTQLGQLTALSALLLPANWLTGGIPTQLGQLTALSYMQMQQNLLTGRIPTHLGQLSALKLLSLFWNQLTGVIPTQLAQLTALTTLSLDINELTGTIPPQFGQLVALEDLDLSFNQLTGTIPTALTQLTNLDDLSLDRNNLTGLVPSGFCAAPFPDWRNAGGGSFAADCMGEPEIQCDCCNRCYDESGNCLRWSTVDGGFVSC